MTYNNKPSLTGAAVNSGGHGGAAWVTVDVTSLISGDGSYSLALVSSNAKAVSYPSDESSTNRPQLVVETGAGAGASLPTSTSLPPTVTSVPPTATSPAPTATGVPPSPTAVVPAGPATLTIAPAADAYVDSGEANRNFGTSQIVRTDANPEQRTYLRFVVQGVAGRTITQAVLRIYANGSSKTGFRVQGVPDNNWSEASINYNNQPRTSGEIAVSGAHSHSTWLAVDITQYIQGDGTYSIALLTDSTKPVSYPSREAPANQPQLVVTIGN
jgi:hypothetical protein